MLGISVSKLYSITTCTALDEVWKALTSHFGQDSLSSKLFLKEQYFRKEMIEGTSVEDHLKQMKELTDKLTAIGAPIEEDQVVTLLGSLSTSYSMLVTALEARSNRNLTLSYVQQALIDEEQKRVEQSIGSKYNSALVGDIYRKKKINDLSKRKIQYYQCKRYGHYKRSCPELIKIEYPTLYHKVKVEATHSDSEFDGAFGAAMSEAKEQLRLVDSGALSHITWNNELLHDLKQLHPSQKVGQGDGHTVDAIGTGKVRINMLLDNQAKTAVFSDVLYVPLACNLFSVKAVAEKGNKIKFYGTNFWINSPKGNL